MVKLGAHTCHARNCTTEVPPKMFMCKTHWGMVDGADQDKLWSLYRPGQERTKDPSMEYLSHAMDCIGKVAAKEAAK